VKLFQIEEPDGSPADRDAPGAAIGLDLTGTQAEVAIAIGGNAAVMNDGDGFELDLAVPASSAALPEWQALLEGARLRAERALARPVTHAVVVADAAAFERLTGAAAEADLLLLRIVPPEEFPPTERRVLAAAILAEDLAPRPTAP
jgi:hypothetical protein